MLGFNFREASERNGSVVIKLTNNLKKTLKISSDTILMDGFTSEKFQVKDSYTGNTLTYKGISKKYRPKKIDLEEHNKLESKLDLKEVYDLEKCHKYEVSFQTILVTEESVENLAGIVNIDMEC